MSIPCVRLSTAGDLVAAVPVLCGYHPQRSLVVVLTAAGLVTLSMRIGLPEDVSVEVFATDLASKIPPQAGADSASLVVIHPTDAHAALITAMGPALRLVGIDVVTVVWATSTQMGGSWRTAGGHDSGLVEDPTTTPLGIAEAAYTGRTIAPDRRAVADTVAPAVEDATLTRRKVLIEDGEAIGEQPSVAQLTAAVREVERGNLVLDDETVTRLARALLDRKVRDEVLGWPTREWADHAHELWRLLVREIPAPYVADAACALALSAMVRSEPVLADVSLRRAETADPTHRLTGLLRQLLTAPISPAELRKALTDGLF